MQETQQQEKDRKHREWLESLMVSAHPNCRKCGKCGRPTPKAARGMYITEGSRGRMLSMTCVTCVHKMIDALPRK